LPLEGLKVVDSATLFAGPLAAGLLGDYGADVIKLEHPKGDPARNHGAKKNGVPLWWKQVSRNKKSLALNLSSPDGQAVMRDLVADIDVWVENFRPGTLERWGLGYDVLSAINPKLVLTRVTGFGQFGPHSRRPGFGTLAEAMSGFAALTGEVDGPPTLPPFGLGDGVAGISAAFATMVALHAREATGKGQVVDVALIEPLMSIVGPHAIIFDQTGTKQKRTGNRSAKNAPRNTYRTKDNKWVAISTSSDSIAQRVMHLIGWPEVVDEPWFKTAGGRVQHVDELDGRVAEWIAARPMNEVIAAFEKAEAAIAPVYDVEDILADPQMQALDTITTVHDEDLGPVRMQNVIARLSGTPGAIRFTGRALGADTDAILGALPGYDAVRIAELRAGKVVA
jgi:formyl-CoA transferase